MSQSRVDTIDRAVCRAEALRRFSPPVMAAGYEAMYRAVTKLEERPAPKALELAAFPLLDEVSDTLAT